VLDILQVCLGQVKLNDYDESIKVKEVYIINKEKISVPELSVVTLDIGKLN
jgi:hypothetical protein